MKKGLFSVMLLCACLVCCKNSAKEVQATGGARIENNGATAMADSLKEDNLGEGAAPCAGTVTAGYLKNIVDILLPFSYRIFCENDLDPAKKINSDWVSIYRDSAKNYYTKQADFSIEDGYSECVYADTKVLTSKDDVVLFMNLPHIKKGKIDHLNIPRTRIWPNDTLRIEFKGASYNLHATGNILGTYISAGDTLHNIDGYKLYISTGDKPAELLLDIESFEGTFMCLFFIGDIDGDGIPDFIFETPTHYELESVTLFLSTIAEKGKITKKAAELGIWFDC